MFYGQATFKIFKEEWAEKKLVKMCNLYFSAIITNHFVIEVTFGPERQVCMWATPMSSDHHQKPPS